MFKKLKERLRDKTKEKLYTHLVNLGIDAELVEKGAPDDIGKTSQFTPFKGVTSDVGSIKVIGKEIDVIQINRYSGDWGATSFELVYAVKGQVKGKDESVTAKTKLKTKGVLQKQVLDFEWTGGEIAEILNSDQSLKKSMLQEQAMIFSLGYAKIEIKPDKKKSYVRIHAGGAFPSEKVFECYNRIAKHLRQLLQ